MKCYACKSGKLMQHGCFYYCDNCTISVFAVTNDYISSCAALIGTLVSNTNFTTVESWTGSISDYINKHTPALAEYIKTNISDEDGLVSFMHQFANEVLEHAINVELPDTVREAHKPVNSVCVGCGSSFFIYDADKPLATCANCEVVHIKDAKESLEPAFRCNCGSIRYTVIDELLAECTNCNAAFRHNNELNFMRCR